MSRFMRGTFMVHLVISGLTGALMLLIPGRFLLWFGWAPIDPIVSRLFGAALLGLAWGDVRAVQGLGWDKARVLVEIHAVFNVLACAGILRHLLQGAGWLPIVWLLLAVFVLFAIAWIVGLARERA